MKLLNGILRPGTVTEVLDKGNIKATVPGLFSPNDSPDTLPPIYPFTGWNANKFSSIKQGENVWVLNFSDNPMQLYWFRKDDIDNNNELMKEENVDIICNRETSFGWATIYFSDGSGWVIKNDDSIIQIDKDGNILLSKSSEPHRTIHINDDGISLGSKGKSAHPAVYADELTNILQNIQISLELVQKAALNTPFTMGIATALGTKPIELKLMIPKITSPHVTLD